MMDTQLPWAARRNETSGARVVIDAQDCEIAQVFGDTENIDERAQLLASAPAMLEALERANTLLADLRAHDLDDAKDRQTLALVDAAIAAARGDPKPTSEIWLSTIIRKDWEPRMSWAASEGELIADALEYASEVAEIEISEAASMAEIAYALDEQAGEQLYWERAR